MAFSLDHIIIAVNDLETAITDFTALGFTVIRGGEHASGTTHNALICFADGTYIELIAPTGKAPQPGVDFRYMLAMGEGLVGYALQSNDLAADVRGLRERGITINDADPGGRKRPDGVSLRWKSAMMGQNIAPFFIEDETPRNLRVPDDAVTITHENGVVGVQQFDVLAENLAADLVYFEALLGVSPQNNTFSLPNMNITLRPAEDAATQQYYHQRHHAPYRLLLRTTHHTHDLNDYIQLV